MTKDEITPYERMVSFLRVGGEDNLRELFHDIDDIKAVIRIAEEARDFCDDYGWTEKVADKISQDEDAKEIDDAQRLRDHKSDDRRPY